MVKVVPGGSITRYVVLASGFGRVPLATCFASSDSTLDASSDLLLGRGRDRELAGKISSSDRLTAAVSAVDWCEANGIVFGHPIHVLRCEQLVKLRIALHVVAY